MTKASVTFLILWICQASFLLGSAYEDQVDLKYRLPANIVTPTNYKLHLTPDLKKCTFDGEVVITVKALTNNDTLTLNSKDLAIVKVEFKDLNTTRIFKAYPVIDEKHESLKIIVEPSFEKNHYFSLTIKYAGILNDNKKGFYRSRITERGKQTGYIAVTHFEPTGARLAFPCWDEPIYKAKFSISLTHNKTLQAISNMPISSEKEEKGGMVTTSFAETQMMSTYLVAFMVGDYVWKEDRSDNMLYRVWTKNSTLGLTDYALKMGRKLLEELNEYTSIPYYTFMTDKIDQVSLEDFSAGAMENWGLVTYRESNLLYDENKTTTRTKINILTVIAHEFSHQWFGNLVTPKWWQYLWLNEGFANYFQYFIAHKVEPELRLDDMFVVENMQGNAMIADADPVVRPMSKNVSSPREIRDLFDSIAYQKASSIIRMVIHVLTEQVFKKGLKNYLNRYALRNVDSNDLFESLQEALDDADNLKRKEPMKKVMTEWVEKSGYPIISVMRIKGGYQLTQNHFVILMIKIDEYNTKWWVPITYVEESNPNFSNTTPVDWFDPSEKSHTVKSKAQKGWYIFNTQQTGYYRVNYDVDNWKLLTDELKKGNTSKIHLLNRAQLIDDAMNIARTKRLNYIVPLELTLYLRHEVDYIPWQPAFRHLSFLQNLLRTSKQYYIFKRYVAYLMRSLTKHVGYRSKANDSDLVKMLRVTAMRWACEVGVKSCTTYAEKEYYYWLKNPKMQLDIDLKNEILCAGVRNANDSAWQTTKKYLVESMKDEEENEALMLPLACSNSFTILEQYLKSTLQKKSVIDFQIAVAHVVSRNPASVHLVYNFVINEYANIQKLEHFGNTMKAVAKTVGGAITDIQHHLNLIAFLLDRKLTEPLEAAMAKATRNMMWIKQHRSTVETWLATNSELFDSPDDDNNNASSIAIATFLVIFSLIITRFY